MTSVLPITPSASLTGCKNLVWWPELGMGWHPSPPIAYDGDYWQEYLQRDSSPMGRLLTQARVELVGQYIELGRGVDIGIGAGAYVRAAGCSGFDVMPEAKAWLKQCGRWADPYRRGAWAITCWDSLEHIPDPTRLLDLVREWVFVSLPIFDGPEHVLQSRHYKPGEHIWYWTRQGFINFMSRQGFVCLEANYRESIIGRDGIMSFVFRRPT